MIIRHSVLKSTFLVLTFFYYLGFLSFVTGIFSTPGEDTYSAHASGSIANQIIGLVILALSLIILFKARVTTFSLCKKHFLLWGILIFWFTLSIYWSYAPSVTFRRTVAFSTMVLAIYCLVQLFPARSLLAIFAFATGLAAFLGLLEAIVSPSTAFVNEGIRAGAFSGIYFDKNGGARVYSYGLLVMVGLQLYKTRVGLMICLLLISCLLMSRSATALLMVVSGISLILFFNIMYTRDIQKNFVRFISITLSITLVTFLMMEGFELILSILGRSPDLTNRTVIWQLMDAYVNAEFLHGYGFGAFWASEAVQEFTERWSYIGNAHSGYYEALLHGGIVCLIIVFIIIIHGIYLLISNYVHCKEVVVTTTLFSIFTLQIVVNYIGYLITNHNSVDMFIFVLAYFAAFKSYTTPNIQKSRYQNA